MDNNFKLKSDTDVKKSYSLYCLDFYGEVFHSVGSISLTDYADNHFKGKLSSLAFAERPEQIIIKSLNDYSHQFTSLSANIRVSEYDRLRFADTIMRIYDSVLVLFSLSDSSFVVSSRRPVSSFYDFSDCNLFSSLIDSRDRYQDLEKRFNGSIQFQDKSEIDSAQEVK